MKTQILQLETHDDLISTLDKMAWSQTGRLLLVWPEKGKVLNRRMDLVRLRRRSNQLGAQVALVTKDPQVVYQAKRAGIPTYTSVKQAQHVHWRLDRRFRPAHPLPGRRVTHSRSEMESERAIIQISPAAWMTKSRFRVTAFLVGILAILSLVAVFLPSAAIKLVPEREQAILKLNLRADPNINAFKLSGIVPARIATVVVSGRKLTKVSGETTRPDQYASGRVVFSNLTDTEIEIPDGVIIRTAQEPAIRFKTIQDGTLAPGVGVTISLPVKAVTPGPESNLKPNSLVIIEGPLGLSMAVKNPLPTSGGSSQTITQPSEDEQQTLLASLSAELKTTAEKELIAGLSPGDVLFSGTITPTQIINSQFSPPPGLPGETLELDLQIEYEAYYAQFSDIDQLINQILISNKIDGYYPLLETVTIHENLDNSQSNDGLMSWQATVQYTTQAELDPAQIASEILGSSPEKASSQIQSSVPLEHQPEITIWPAGWFRLPLLPFRIDIQIPREST